MIKMTVEAQHAQTFVGWSKRSCKKEIYSEKKIYNKEGMFCVKKI